MMLRSSSTDSSRELDEATYAITADTGKLGEQAALLCQSISYSCPNSTVVTFIPEYSYPSVDEDVLQTLQELSTVVTGEVPIPNYPISALQQALIEAAKIADSEYLVALDTDTVVVEPPTIPHETADLYARPASLADAYWTHPQSRDDWAQLYDFHDVEFPDSRLTGAVDDEEILPFYNAGLVVTSDYEFPQEWLEVTRSTIDDNILPRDESFYNDQLALAVLASKYDTETLATRENFPVSAYLRCPSDVTVLHYGRLYQLSLLTNREVRSKLKEIGWEASIPRPSEVAARLLITASFQSSRVFSYETRQRLRSLARTSLPDRIVNLEG